MDNLIKKIVELIKKAPKPLKIVLIVLLCSVLGCFSWLYVSCGTLDLKDVHWQYGEGSVPPISGTPLDILE